MTLDFNKQKMYYSLQDKEVPIYETDENGDIVYYEDLDGNRIPLETGETKKVYSEPVEFLGNIAMSGGESETVEYGIDLSQYAATLVVDKDLLPINETSIIWHKTEPVIKEDGTVDEFSADYTVVKLSPSLNFDRYILQKVVK